MAETIHDFDGLKVIPTLTRTADGWVEKQPTPCPECGGVKHLVGWFACACRTDTLMGGHRSWICRSCDTRRTLGCSGRTTGAMR